MNWIILISIIAVIGMISWFMSDDFFDFLFYAFAFIMFTTVIIFSVGEIMAIRKYNANVSESIGCKPLIVESEKQFEVWQKEKHGGTYSMLLYSIAHNEFGITNIEYAPGDIIPSKKEDNTIMVEVIKVTNDVIGTKKYAINNQSRSCL